MKALNTVAVSSTLALIILIAFGGATAQAGQPRLGNQGPLKGQETHGVHGSLSKFRLVSNGDSGQETHGENEINRRTRYIINGAGLCVAEDGTRGYNEFPVSLSAHELAARLRSDGAECADLRARDLSGTDLSQMEFKATLLSGAKLTGARLDGAKFVYADLSGAQMRGVSISSTTRFEDSNLSFTRFSSERLETRSIINCNLVGSDGSDSEPPAASASLIDI